MSENIASSLDLAKATSLILSRVCPCGGEEVELKQALGRVAAVPLCARIPQPGFDQSTRDGFVIGDRGSERRDGCRQYTIQGEIAAGSRKERSLPLGRTSRIMTGGLVPIGSIRVIPHEDCSEQDGLLSVPEAAMRAMDSYVRRRGSLIDQGQVIVEKGEVIGTDYQALLAATGLLTSIEVYRRPRVAYFCTGSELLAEGDNPGAGMKISSNRYLLDGLISEFGGKADDRGVVRDLSKELHGAITSIDPAETDIVISTGGMGPGKYDLLEEAFVAAGGRVLYSGLNLRPGKSTLFGVLGSMLFFGLPGPPPAVRVLFNELVRPALLGMLGVKEPLPGSTRAVLTEEVHLKRAGVPGLKGGCFALDQGKCTVRLAKRNDPATCYLLFPANRRRFRKGESISVHFVNSLFSSCPL